ncbi:response regulator transcription factor [Glaciihabitans sp. INWT7]|nr:response regulator transcription factor [Glaciihabitans sp. INWT7]
MCSTARQVIPDPMTPCPRSAMIRILIVDDHTAFTELLTDALDREPDLVTVGSTDSGRRGIGLCRELNPDLVVLYTAGRRWHPAESRS